MATNLTPIRLTCIDIPCVARQSSLVRTRIWINAGTAIIQIIASLPTIRLQMRMPGLAVAVLLVEACASQRA